jgi:hypothetical protein
MKSGRELAALRPRFAGRLPSGAFPTSGFLRGCFAFGFWAGTVAFVAFAGFDFGLSMLSPVRGRGSADIIRFNERSAQLVAAHIPFIRARIDQLALCHLRSFPNERRRLRYTGRGPHREMSPPIPEQWPDGVHSHFDELANKHKKQSLSSAVQSVRLSQAAKLLDK